VPTSLAHSIVTAGAITIGELDMQTGCTADITLGGNMIIDDAGSENGFCTITAGTYDTSATDYAFTADGDVSVTGTFTGNASAVSNGSLAIPSGGTYDATSGTTTITAESASGWAIYAPSGATFTHNSGTVAYTGSVHTNIGQTVTFYHFTHNPGATRVATITGGDITIAGNFLINDGTIHTHAVQNNALTVTGTTTIGDGSGAASTAQLVCNSSDVDLNGVITVDSDGEISLPDASGSFNFADDFDNDGGVVTHNDGTVTWDGSASGYINVNGATEISFYNLTENASGLLFLDDSTTVENTITVNSAALLRVSGYRHATILTIGTSSSAGSITGPGSIAIINEDRNAVTIKAASSEYPVLVDCLEIDMDLEAGAGSVISLMDIDGRWAWTTGAGGGTTFTLTRCKFGLGATISSGDIIKIAANTASGFKKIEGAGTLQIVRGGGVVILDGIADPVNLSNVALPTALNPAQICCNTIQGVSS